MNFNQRVIAEFMSLGDVSQRDANVALQVYLELCEVRKYWDVEYFYHADLNVLYFTAKKNKSEKASVFVPRSSNDELSYKIMQSYFALCGDSDAQSVFLALVSSDSTCVFYQITNGLCEPTDTSAKHLRINKREKLDADLKRNRRVIEEAALCGIPITLTESSSEKNQ